jgi:hypothetical protein
VREDDASNERQLDHSCEYLWIVGIENMKELENFDDVESVGLSGRLQSGAVRFRRQPAFFFRNQ